MIAYKKNKSILLHIHKVIQKIYYYHLNPFNYEITAD